MTNPDPALTTRHEAEFAVFLATLAPGEPVGDDMGLFDLEGEGGSE